MNRNPLVSLITPGWNGKDFIHNLLDSILNQTYQNLEYIYIDDGSSDGTKDIVLSYKEKFKERGIKFLYIYKQNGGVSSAINEGLKYVKGEYLCWPEYDDILLPESVELKVKYLEEHPDCAVVTSDAWLVNIDNINKKQGVLSYHNPNRFDRNHFVQSLLTNSIFTAACHMIRMSMFDAVNPTREIYPSPIGPNWQMLLPLYYKYNRGFIEKPLLYYVIRPDSISHSNNTLEQKIASIDEYIRILKYILDQVIMMPESDRKLYHRLIDEKYAIDRMELGIQFHDGDLFYKWYKYCKENNISPALVNDLKKQFECRIYYTFIKFLKRITKRLIIK